MRRAVTVAMHRAIGAVSESLTVQFTVALVPLAFLPTMALGWLALQSISTASRETATRAHSTTASAAATTLGAFVETAARDLVMLCDRLGTPQDRAADPQLRRFVVEHPYFRRVTIVAADVVVSTSAIVNPPTILTPRQAVARLGRVTLTRVTPDDDLLQTAELVTPIVATGALLVADLRLEYLWRIVGELDLPPQAQAIVADETGQVLAHSNPSQYGAVARGVDLRAHPLLRASTGRVTAYSTPDGEEWLASAAPLPRLPWTLVVEQPTATVDQPARTARRQLSGVLLLALGSTLLVVVVVGRMLTAPLRTLTHATHALARGEPVASVPVPRHRQLADLAQAFNVLLAARTSLEATVRRQERDAVIGQVGGGLVHDLAHPITNIVNNARLLSRLSPEARHDCLQLIEREHATVEELFEHLREFARSTTVTPLAQHVVPHHVIREIAALLGPEAEARGVSLQIVAPPVMASIQTDHAAIRRVLRNLALNAIEAAEPTRGTVTLGAEDVDTELWFTIRDTGPGLSPERLATLFDPWRSTKRKGLGLGLATAKRVVEEEMGGRLTATSIVGTGTRCVVALRRQRISAVSA